MTKAEEILIDIEFTLDMYSAGADGAENALEKVREILKPVVSLNENQKLLLEDLREIKESQKDKNMLGLIWVLGQRFTTKSNIKSFTDQEILVVLQALEQEEGNDTEV